MSHIDRGILGPIHGNLATVNGYSCYGKDFIRSRITDKKDAKSEKQLIIRSGFKDCSDFLKPIYYTTIADTFPYMQFEITNWFQFFKLNLRFFHGNDNVDYDQILISIGNLDIAPDYRINFFYPDARILLRWTGTWDNINSFPNDLLSGFVYNLTRHQAIAFFNESPRSQQTAFPDIMPDWLESDILMSYGYFKTSDSLRITDTMFATWNI